MHRAHTMSMSAETRLGTALHKLGSYCIGKGKGGGGGHGAQSGGKAVKRRRPMLSKLEVKREYKRAKLLRGCSSLNELDAIYGSNALRRYALGINLIEAYAKVKRTWMT